MFLLNPRMVVDHGTEPGSLLSITDTEPQHRPGQVYYDRANDKAYIYAYNGVGSDCVANTPYCIEYAVSAVDPDSDTYAPVVAVALADDASYYMVGVAPAAIPSTYWGWYQVYGRVAAMVTPSLDTTTGKELRVTAGAVAEVSATAIGQEANTFALVRTGSAAAATSQDVFLLGREFCLATS